MARTDPLHARKRAVAAGADPGAADACGPCRRSGQLRGIVSAPSFHTAAAVLYIAAGWRIAALRWPIVALNAAMLLSTPVEGTHYLIDMILGLGVALTALALMEVHRRRCAASA
ncbi:phosphatase PAP2 family protein [Sphingobium yanoikuyae]|uniref:phosphatase PAP2 family protein n=1 Tax=Sphingobium yanoikuyae TaxID=13690 RepID=UPI0030C8A75F